MAGKSNGRHYPPIFEKLVPVALVIIVVVMIILLAITVGVVLNLF